MTNNHKDIHAVIPAAGVAKNKIMFQAHLPDTMTPINGKPVIGYILDDLLIRDIRSATIVLGPHDMRTEKYVTLKYGSKLDLECVYNSAPERGPGYSVLLGCTKKNKSILVYLGDTIYKGPLSFKKDFLITAKFQDQPSKWCFVSRKKSELVFINKPQLVQKNSAVLVGIYYFSDGAFLLKCGDQTSKKLPVIEVSDILLRYQKKYTFTLKTQSGWYDCGNIENYYRAKVDFLKLRNFNQIQYNDLYGYITKTSSDTSKIRDEIFWYKNLPAKLQLFAPRIFSIDESVSKASYSIEFYGYQSLADLFVFESIHVSLWESIIDRLFAILAEFEKQGRSQVISRMNYTRMLSGKLEGSCYP